MRDRLSAGGIDTAMIDARVLLQHVLGVRHEYLIAQPGHLLSEQRLLEVEQVVARRLEFEPVSRITGVREFYGREFTVSRHVLDPRPDSEVLVDQAIKAARLLGNGTDLKLLDVGTGSGALIVTLLCELEGAHAVASDISADALKTAHENARRHSVDDRLKLVNTNWIDDVCESFDIVVSNPPYIETAAIAGLARDVREFDPHLALDGGCDGLDAYRAIIPQAHERLNAGGFICLEIGKDQADAVWRLVSRAGLTEHSMLPRTATDLAGLNRVITAWKS